jgi:hypothetical protein
MPYDITAIATCTVVLAFVLWDGHISKIEAYILTVCCLVLGATSWVSNFMQTTLFTGGWNAYVVAGVLGALVIWKGPAGKAKAFMLGVCALILGSTYLVTSTLPPLVNGVFAMIGAIFTNGL